MLVLIKDRCRGETVKINLLQNSEVESLCVDMQQIGASNAVLVENISQYIACDEMRLNSIFDAGVEMLDDVLTIETANLIIPVREIVAIKIGRASCREK